MFMDIENTYVGEARKMMRHFDFIQQHCAAQPMAVAA
jgi:hypothetical protein